MRRGLNLLILALAYFDLANTMTWTSVTGYGSPSDGDSYTNPIVFSFSTGSIFSILSGGTINVKASSALPLFTSGGSAATLTAGGTVTAVVITGPIIGSTAYQVTVPGGVGTDTACVLTIPADNFAAASQGTITFEIDSDAPDSTGPGQVGWTVSAASAPAPAVVGSDPITWRGDQKIKFWLPSNTFSPALTTPSLKVLMSPLQGPTKDLQWISTFKVTTAEGFPLVHVSVKNNTLAPFTSDSFHQIDVMVGMETTPRRIFESEALNVGQGAWQIVIGRRRHDPPRVHGHSTYEYVQVQDKYITFLLFPSHAGNEFRDDYEKQQQYAHLDFFIMDKRFTDEAPFKGVFPELWGWTEMTKETEAMLVAPSMKEEARICVSK